METRAFQIDHNKLLLDVIRRQAGTLAKAILEGVMNAVDAGATRCDISIDETSAMINDNGKGFQTKEDIQTWFEVFGAAHSAEEQKTFGTFRMGRGQMFAFGKNTWCTNQHIMVVNIEQTGCSYQYTQAGNNYHGCSVSIELYKKLNEYEVERTVREVESALCWLDMPVTINGKDVYPRVEDFCRWLNNLGLTRYQFQHSTVGDVVDLSTPTVFPTQKLLSKKRKWVYLLENAGAELYEGHESPRGICVGESATGSAWTDGRSFICFDRKYLKGLIFTNAGFYEAGRVLLHEICHADASGDQEHHDQAFYERFHDRSVKLYKFVETARQLSKGYVPSARAAA